MLKRVIIGSDHAAFHLKKILIDHITKKGFQCQDKGSFSTASCDYPDIAFDVCRAVKADPLSLGLLMCGSGIGISIAANKVNGIKCALCYDHFTVDRALRKDHCNVLAFGLQILLLYFRILGSRIIGEEIAKEMVDHIIKIRFL